jgi:hypothetical protein
MLHPGEVVSRRVNATILDIVSGEFVRIQDDGPLSAVNQEKPANDPGHLCDKPPLGGGQAAIALPGAPCPVQAFEKAVPTGLEAHCQLS